MLCGSRWIDRLRCLWLASVVGGTATFKTAVYYLEDTIVGSSLLNFINTGTNFTCQQKKFRPF